MRLLRCVLSAGLVGALALSSDHAQARRPRARHHPDWARHPATRYAAMDAPRCLAELAHRGVTFSPVPQAPGVRIPVRLRHPVGGVLYRSDSPQHVRDSGPYDVFDCRLALSLHDLSKVLRAHDIDEVRIYSAWRPAKLGGHEPLRHAAGLAVDVARLGKRVSPHSERVWLRVERDFGGRIGAPVCGTAAALLASAEARELRSIACEVADQHLFTSILTPNYNWAHRNHIHLEITPEVRWYLLL
jgi:hypothetical protein